MSTSQILHLNLFGMYQPRDGEVVPEEKSWKYGEGEGVPGSENMMETRRKHDQETMMSRQSKEPMMWEQAHRRNYVIVEER